MISLMWINENTSTVKLNSQLVEMSHLVFTTMVCHTMAAMQLPHQPAMVNIGRVSVRSPDISVSVAFIGESQGYAPGDSPQLYARNTHWRLSSYGDSYSGYSDSMNSLKTEAIDYALSRGSNLWVRV